MCDKLRANLTFRSSSINQKVAGYPSAVVRTTQSGRRCAVNRRLYCSRCFYLNPPALRSLFRSTCSLIVIPMERIIGSNNSAQLRKVLNDMFPQSYIQMYHQPPNSVCSLLNTRCWNNQSANLSPDDQQAEQHLYLEASTEPLRDHFNASLAAHQAKRMGLCPIRRAIYDQCFGRSSDDDSLSQ